MYCKTIKNIALLISLIICFNNYTALSKNNTNKPKNIQIKTSGKDLNDFIPKGWKLIAKANGDLNKDNLADIAAVIECTIKPKKNNYPEEWLGQPRKLLVVFKQKDGTYKLSVQSSTIIMKSEQGRVYGDPFEGIKCSQGSIVVSSYGGSAWRWGFTERYRFQNKGWYLIGVIELSEDTHTGESKTIDTNCLTGKQIITTYDKKGNKKVVTCNIGKKKLDQLKDN